MIDFKKILFVADGSEGEDIALSLAADIASDNGATLTLFDAVEVGDFSPSDAALGSALEHWREVHVRQRLDELEALWGRLKSDYQSLKVNAKARPGNTARSAIRTVISDQYDLVVKAPQGGARKFGIVFGSTDLKLMRQCPCPVWIIRPAGRPTFARILAAVDINPNEPEVEPLAREILRLSTSLASKDGSELHVVHAWDLFGEAKSKGGQIDRGTREKILSDLESVHRSGLGHLIEAYPYEKTEVHLKRGDAGDVIADFVENKNIDLLVIGTVGRTGIPGLVVGNTAEKVFYSVDCSVLALKPDGFQTPIEA